MKKRTLLLGAAVATLSFFAIKNHYKKEEEKLWFTLENIEYNPEIRRISGECIEGTYLGEMEVYLPDNMDDSILKNGITIKVQGGPGMTMSIPPQLMNCTKIEIIQE